MTFHESMFTAFKNAESRFISYLKDRSFRAPVFGDKAPELVAEAGYIPLPADAYHLAKINLQRFDVGTVFEGSAQIDLTISDLMREPAKF